MINSSEINEKDLLKYFELFKKAEKLSNDKKKKKRKKNSSKKAYQAADFLNYNDAMNVANDLIRKRKRIGLLILFGVNLGLRYSDLSKLHDRDIEAARKNNNELILFEIKTGKRRIIMLNDKVLEAYDKFPQVGYLFRSQKGSVFDISYINKVLKKLFKTNDSMNISSHSLRKTFARTIYNQAENKEDALIRLSNILNHRSIADTRIYLGITKEENNKIYKSLETLVIT